MIYNTTDSVIFTDFDYLEIKSWRGSGASFEAGRSVFVVPGDIHPNVLNRARTYDTVNFCRSASNAAKL